MSTFAPTTLRDENFMSRALLLAARGLYTTTPNPRVGCVIVNDGHIVGEGWHVNGGAAHAEVNALEQAGTRALGGTLYVTLEPCAHFGQTPPCVEAIVKSGISRVVFAAKDPNPLVDGKGAARLKSAGIAVIGGVLDEEAKELNLGFFKRMQTGRPWVRVKIASGLDGKTALENGKSQWITSTAAREDAHKWRAQSCAILTGVGTVVEDDPRLTVRHVDTDRQPTIVVVDSQLRSPLSAKLFKSSNVTIATAVSDKTRLLPFVEIGANVLVLPDSEGKVDLLSLLDELGATQINEVLVEAGINLHSALLRRSLIDEMIIYYAPKFLGSHGRGMLFFDELESMDEVAERDIVGIERFGKDFRVTVRF